MQESTVAFSPPQAAVKMTSSSNAFHLDGFDDFSKQQGIDFFSYQAPADVLAPHPDLFESELDSSLAGIDEGQLQLLTVDSHDAYSFLRSDTPTRGPPSAITELSSRSSAYDSELYAPSYAHTQYSFPLDLEMDFQRIRVENDFSDYNAHLDTQPALDFGTLPPTPPLSPPRPQQKQHYPRTAFSDYGPPTRSVPSYYSYIPPPVGTVSPNHITTQLPTIPAMSHRHDEKHDSRKRYQCPSCPRGNFYFFSYCESHLTLYSFRKGLQSQDTYGYP